MTNDLTGYLLLIPLGYLIGSIPFGLIAGKLVAKIDIRDYGSGKMGMTNVLRTSGLTAAIIVLLLDMGKGVVAVLIARLLFDLPGVRSRRGSGGSVRTQLARLHRLSRRTRHRLRLGRTAHPVAARRHRRHSRRPDPCRSDALRLARLHHRRRA